MHDRFWLGRRGNCADGPCGGNGAGRGFLLLMLFKRIFRIP